MQTSSRVWRREVLSLSLSHLASCEWAVSGREHCAYCWEAKSVSGDSFDVRFRRLTPILGVRVTHDSWLQYSVCGTSCCLLRHNCTCVQPARTLPCGQIYEKFTNGNILEMNLSNTQIWYLRHNAHDCNLVSSRYDCFLIQRSLFILF